VNEDVERLCELVAGDGALAEALWNERDPRVFEELVVRLARERSLRIDEHDVRAAMADANQRWLARTGG
jgi:hypothetical protein